MQSLHQWSKQHALSHLAAAIRRFSATTNDSNSSNAGQLLRPLSAINIMSFFSLPEYMT